MRTDVFYRQGLVPVILADIILDQKYSRIPLHRAFKLMEKVCDPGKQLVMQILE